MSDLLKVDDLSLLLRLFLGHVIADFALLTDTWVQEKHENLWKSPRFYLHALWAGFLVTLFSGQWQILWLSLLIFISHILTGSIKSRVKDALLPAILIQFFHIVIILGCWLLLTNIAWTQLFDQLCKALPIAFWVLVLAYTVMLFPAGAIISKMTEPWRNVLIQQNNFEGLARAGLWIGRLERTLILTFVLLNRYEAIGFLIAAKSVFRFGEIRDPANRKEAEYILIGTLISFATAILWGIATRFALKHL